MANHPLHPGERTVLIAFRDSPRQFSRLHILARKLHVKVPELLRKSLAKLLDESEKR